MKRHRPSIVSIYLDPSTIAAVKARSKLRGDPMRLIIETAIRLYLHITPAVIRSRPKGITNSDDARRYVAIRWARVRARKAERLAEGAK